MKISRSLALAATLAAASSVGSAHAQQVAAPQMYFNNALEVAMPPDGVTTTIPLTGLKVAHGAWVTFVKFTQGKPVQDAQVMSIMEGVTVNWAGTKENCVHELRLVPSPAALTIVRTGGMCALKPPGNAIFRVIAM